MYSYGFYNSKGKHLEYRNAHCPGAFEFVIKSVKEPKDNLHFLDTQYTSEEGRTLLYISYTSSGHSK